MALAFSNQGELPFAMANKWVAYKHIEFGVVHPLGYVLAHTVLQLPIALVESGITSVILYWLVDLVGAHARGLAAQRWALTLAHPRCRPPQPPPAASSTSGWCCFWWMVREGAVSGV